MKKLLIVNILAAACLALATAGGAQDFSQYPNPEFAKMIAGNPALACNTACPYELALQNGPDTKAPKGYKPFYISHYGRHGSRSGWDRERYDRVISELSKAKEAGILAAAGDSLLQETMAAKQATNNMDGRLTVRGQREHREIAGRMYERFPEVFRGSDKNIRVLTSTVPRCIVSMAAFTNRLCSMNSRLSIVMDCGSEIQKELSNDESQAADKRRNEISAVLRKTINPDLSGMMGRLFSDPEAAKQFIPDTKEFSRDIYAIGQTSRSFDIDLNVHRFLPFDALYGWADYLNMRLYLGQCNSVELGEERMERTKPLVQLILRQADDALASGEIAADLRFGHDLPLIALCCYLGVEGIGERYTGEEARRHFISAFYCPFAGNLQIVFYQSRKAGDPILVKVLMNEREVKLIGLEPVQGPYYRWADLREKISC